MEGGVNVILALVFLDILEFGLFVMLVYVLLSLARRFDFELKGVVDYTLFLLITLIYYIFVVSPVLSWEKSLANVLKLIVDNTILRFLGG